nr:5-hydroxytryptamine receptor 3A-like [Labrus bergylta]
MMLAGFLLIILLQGGFTSDHTEQPELDQQKANQSYEKGGSTFNYTEPTNITQNANQSSVEDGITFNNTETTNFTQNTNQSSVEDGASACNKTYRDLLDHLNLTSNNSLNTMARPTKNPSEPTEIHLDIVLYAILDVEVKVSSDLNTQFRRFSNIFILLQREKEQTFMSCVWVEMIWTDDYMRWDPEEFCDIESITIPSKQLWLPDLTIEERTEKDKATQSPYLRVGFYGDVTYRNDMVLLTTCKMDVYKFPFDIQSCNLTFKSVIYNVKEIKLEKWGGSEWITGWSEQIMRTQSDWEFIDITVANNYVDNFFINQSMMVYTITMKRRSILYIVNFILPVLLFLCLDLASFMISEHGGVKLSFKVTVLLTVTVMQLILNEIIQPSSNRIPLIAMYCVGIFGLMMLSLLETIFVMYLMEKDSAPQNDWTDKEQSLSEDCKDTRGKNKFHTFFKEQLAFMTFQPDEASQQSQTSSSQLTEESNASETEMLQELSPPLSSRKEEGKCVFGNTAVETWWSNSLSLKLQVSFNDTVRRVAQKQQRGGVAEAYKYYRQ